MDPRWSLRLRLLPYLSIPLLATNIILLGLSIRYVYQMMDMKPGWVSENRSPHPPKPWLFTYATIVPVLGIIHALASVIHHRLTHHFPPIPVLIGAVAMSIAWFFMMISWIMCEGLGLNSDIAGSFEEYCPTGWLVLWNRIDKMDAGWWLKTVLSVVVFFMYILLVGCASWTIQDNKRKLARGGGEVEMGKWGVWGRVKARKTADVRSISSAG